MDSSPNNVEICWVCVWQAGEKSERRRRRRTERATSRKCGLDFLAEISATGWVGEGRGGEGRGGRAEGRGQRALNGRPMCSVLRSGPQTKDTEPGGARDLTRQVNQPGLIIHNLLCTTECNTAHHHHLYVHKCLMKTTTLPWCTGAEVDIKSMPLHTRYITRGPNSVLVLPNFFVGMFQC